MRAPSKKVYLTFDDGPDPRNTSRILEILEAENVPAAFFMLGCRVRTFPQIARRVADAGHTIGVHSTTHPRLTLIPEQWVVWEISECIGEMIRAGLPFPRWFRPPFGATNEQVKLMAEFQSLAQILWDIEAFDWEDIPEREIISNVMDRVHDGAIILLHDGATANTVSALPTLLRELIDAGYGFGRLGT